ncbi:MAG: hypothetical protein ACP5OG_04835 [Candidatus Nanoarchaeia archaeon]
MSDDYGFSERRKNKNDKRAKRRFNRYKKGGHFRASDNDNILKRE